MIFFHKLKEPSFDMGVDLIPSMNQKCTVSPFITLCPILQRNYRKMTMKLSFSYNYVVKFHGKNWEP